MERPLPLLRPSALEELLAADDIWFFGWGPHLQDPVQPWLVGVPHQAFPHFIKLPFSGLTVSEFG